ncbi:hypothetical protein [Alkalihalobacterium alkalinitrilicum]|uniref:hypothetical protein n=1 Tax=Alkalihalobacterium alkalinitrilicum TaxID=427920 RepID=UPI000994A954|nr:hypothetical protein [Alkalihalobacterium alkalinitrilicum]
MKNGFAVEIKSDLNLETKKLEDCYYHIYKYEPIDETDCTFVYTEKSSIEGLMKDLAQYNVVQDVHEVVFFESATVEGIFSDYGWKGKYYYLYRDLVQPFMIVGGEDIQINMAKLQIEEDLIAYNTEEKVFFVDQQAKLLVEGYAVAYKIAVKFL